ncbi:MAG: hypothetical protein ACOC56_01140 [Atribacterota bacterium]
MELLKKKDYEKFLSLKGKTVQPYIPDIPEPPIISFYPELINVSSAEWKLIIIDDNGDAIKIIQGEGNPSKVIEWDGYDKNGDIVKVGTNYSYRFICIDENNKPLP